MRRALVFALIFSFGHAPVAMAGRGPRDADFASWGGGETLLQSGQRITRQAAEARAASAPVVSVAAQRLSLPAAVQPALQARTTLAQSGMRKRTKILIAMGVFAAFGGVAIAIDRGVEDSTPSSLGQR